MADYTVKQNDTLAAIQATLTGADGVVVDLTNASSVRFHLSSPGGALKFSGVCTIVNALLGIVRYAWQASDTDTAGTFYADFRVVFLNGSVLSFPNDSYLTVAVEPSLGVP